MNDQPSTKSTQAGIRWWPGAIGFLFIAGGLVTARFWPDMTFQERNLRSAKIIVVGLLALALWWLLLSRTRWRLRWGVAALAALMVGGGLALFKITGVSGDLLPIVEFRWKKNPPVAQPPASAETGSMDSPTLTNAAEFPQFLGPQRNGVLPGPRLDTNWTARPPQVLWRQKIGAAWSGFVAAQGIAVTQEQRGEQECVVARELATGRHLWLHADAARYSTTIAGDGPRATPTISGGRVLTLGATGLLNCLDLATGRSLWKRDVLASSGGKLPDWGFTSAPLVAGELVIVHGGENAARSLHAFRTGDGSPAWSACEASPSYAAPSLVELAGAPQVLAFNHKLITAHDPANGALLWSHPWAAPNVVCSSPAIVSSNRVLFSSGYSYGAELLEVKSSSNGLGVSRVWKSPRLKSKFGHVFVRDGCAFGLDDGVFAAIDLAEGSQRWKEGRYGHGQGLLVGEDYLLMAESGELVLLHPTREGPGELARLRVFDAKTWNPPALAGDLLLVRNHEEAVCLRLSLEENPITRGK